MRIFLRRYLKLVIFIAFGAIFVTVFLNSDVFCESCVDSSTLHTKHVKLKDLLVRPTQFSLPYFHVTKSLSQLGKIKKLLSGHILMFNTIPKTGREMFLLLLEELQGRNSFKHIRLEGAPHNMTIPQIREFTKNISHLIREYAIPLSIDKEIHFTNFTEYGYQSPTYFNVIRDPIEILISRYQMKVKNTSFVNATKPDTPSTFVDCWLQRQPDCSYENGMNYELAVPHFCGHAPDCNKLNNRWALQTAKDNVQRYYSVVGVLEHLHETLFVVERKLPLFFRGANEIYIRRISEPYKKWKRKTSIKSKVKKSLQKLFHAEYEFYYWIKDRLLKDVHHYTSKEGQKTAFINNRHFNFQVETPS